MKRWMLGIGAAAGAAAAGVAVARARRQAVDRALLSRQLQRVDSAHGRNIVILGAGFAGTTATAELIRRLPPASGWTVTLVDRHNYFLFTPLLYHAATGLVDPSAILYPTRALSSASNYVFREATVQAIDPRRQVVFLDDGQLSYDYLVLGLGSVTNFFGKEDDLRHALVLKTAGDAIAMRNRIIDAFEEADICEDPAERRRLLTFVVVGGGATGIELMGAMRGLIRGTLAQQYRRIAPEEIRLVLLEALPEVLPGISRDLASYAVERLRALGIDVGLETPVERVDQDGLVTAGGEFIASRTIVWAAGVRPSPLAGHLDAPTIRNGRIQVNDYLQVEQFKNFFAAGDIAAVEDAETGKVLPPNAAIAVQQGKALAQIILACLQNREPPPFCYHHKGEMVSLGRHEAVAEVKGVRVTGFPAWIMWRGFYLTQLMGFKNRLTVMLDWTFSYLNQRDTVRLEMPCSPFEDEPAGELEDAVSSGSPEPR
jgi:NADH dehydrogenase FAD-containing subunit